MSSNIRPGFETSRVVPLGADDDDGVILDASPAERLGMMWQLACDCWAILEAANGDAQPEFQRHLESIRRSGC